MNSTLTLLCNWKKKTIVKPTGGMKVPPGCTMVSVSISLDDLVTRGKAGFEALHEKLEMFAAMHKFELKGIVEQLATTGLYRIAHCMRDHGTPRFVAKELFKMLVDAHACVWEGAAIKKTASYVMFLRNIVDIEMTMLSVHSGQNTKQKYVLPDTIDEMSVEMLGEELRVAEEVNAKESILAKLRKKFHAKQKEDREEVHKQRTIKKGGKKLSEVEQLLADSKAQEMLEAEYDDVPKKRRK